MAPPEGTRLARRRRQLERRRRARRRLLAGLALAGGALVVLLSTVAVTLVVLDRLDPEGGGADGEPADAEAAGAAAAGEQHTLLLVRTGASGRAESATLLAVDDQRAAAVLIPTGTLVDVPGVGLDRLSLAGQYGGPALVQASVENLLGIAVDRVAAVDGAGLAAWLDRLGGLELEVGEALHGPAADGETVAFEPGAQTLDGAQLARFSSFVGDEGELAVVARQRRVLAALLEAVADGDARAALAEGGADGSWPLEGDADPQWLERLLGAAAAHHDSGASRFRLLPVEPVGGTGPAGRPTYRAETDEVGELREQMLAGSVPTEAAGGALRVQVLNGVGTPGIGQAVERELGGGRVRVVAADNAPSFDEERTRIIVYDETPRSRKGAAWVQRQLGVGTIQLSRQPQSVVDVTIVVGADFPD